MRRLVYWLPALLWATVIFIMSAAAFESAPKTQGFLNRYHLDKPLHILVFAALGWFVSRALRRAHGLSLPKTAALAIIIVALYGASDEWHQSFVPGRDSSITDWFADVVGGALAQLAVWYDARPSTKTNR